MFFPIEHMKPKRCWSLLGMSYDKIHRCPKDYVLYRNDYASLNKCPKCGAPRYKKKLSPAKVLWYFPIILRFRRMYHSKIDSRHLTWHADERIIDGKF